MNEMSINSFYETFINLHHIAEVENLKIIMYRNYESLPNKLTSRDVDIYCQPHERLAWRRVFQKLARREKNKVFLIWSSYYVDKFSVSIKGGKKIEFDINFQLIWYNVDFGSVFSNKVEEFNSKISIFSPPSCLFIAFCHSFLYGGNLPLKHVDRYNDELNSEIFLSYMQKMFGVYAPDLVAKLSNRQNVSRQYSNIIRVYVMIRFLKDSYGLGLFQIPMRYIWGERKVFLNMNY